MAKSAQNPPDLNELIQQMTGLFKESDRGFALITSAWLDDALGELLRAQFVDNKSAADELLTGDSPLATFSSRIKVAHCLALISDTVKRDLNMIRTIRNQFAHERGGLSFDSPAIRDRCFGLATTDERAGSEKVARTKYMLVVMDLLMHFLELTSVVERPASDPDALMRDYFEHKRSMEPMVQKLIGYAERKVAEDKKNAD